MLAGSPNIDEVSDSIDETTFQRWMAADEIGMLGHADKMLGFIAFMIANYIGMKFDNADDLRAITMPWSTPEDPGSGADVYSSLKARYQKAVQSNG